MVCFCVEAEHMHKGSIQNLWRRRNSIYLFQIRVIALLSSHRHKQISSQPSNWNINSDLTAFFRGREGLNPDSSSPVPEGYHQRECGYHHQQKRSGQIHTSAVSLHKPQFSTLLYPGWNLCHNAVMFCDHAEACERRTF